MRRGENVKRCLTREQGVEDETMESCNRILLVTMMQTGCL